MTHEPDWMTELDALAETLCERDLDSAERTRFNQLLRDNPQARQHFRDFMQLHSALEWRIGDAQQLVVSFADSFPTLGLQPVGHAPRDNSDPTESAPVGHAPRDNNTAADSAPEACPTPHRSKKSWLDRASRRPTWPSLAITVVIMMLVVGWMAVTYLPEWVADRGKKSKDESRETKKAEFVAWYMGGRDAEWLDGTKPEKTRLKPGQKLTIAKGLIEIQYITGATVVLVGPAEYEVVGKKNGYLKFGKLTARVEDETAKGFIVETPTTTFEDLGTEFGVYVALNGTAKMHVFDGSVRVRPNGGTAAGVSVVSAGNGVVVEWNKVTAVGSNALAGSFIRSIRAGHAVTMNTHFLVDEDFTTGRASGTTWTSESTGVSAGQEWIWSAPEGAKSPIETEVRSGRKAALIYGLADVYDHDEDPVSPDIELPAWFEVMSNFKDDALPLSAIVSVRVRLPDNLDETIDGMLTAFVANRIFGGFGGNGPRVSVYNVTDERLVLPVQYLAPFSPKGNSGWNLKAYPIKLTSDDVGDTIEIRFAERIVAGKAATARGLQIADVQLSVSVTDEESTRTGRSAVDLGLPTE